MEQILEFNSSNGEENFLPCENCQNITCHKVIYSIFSTERYGDGEPRDFIRFEIIQCLGCKRISFKKQTQCEADFSYDQFGSQEINTTIELFPPRVEGRHKLKNSWRLPMQLKRVYDETNTAINNDQRILATIGIRTLIEAICVNKACNGKNLWEKINNLVKIGILTIDGAKILQHLRGLGNRAAHKIELPELEDLNLAMDVVEHLLNGVYILPQIASKWTK